MVADMTGISDNTAISTWTDTINNRQAVQATSANQPIYRAAVGNAPAYLDCTDGSRFMEIATCPEIRAALASDNATVLAIASNPTAGFNASLFSTLNGSDGSGFDLKAGLDGVSSWSTGNGVPLNELSSGIFTVSVTSKNPRNIPGNGSALVRLNINGGPVVYSANTSFSTTNANPIGLMGRSTANGGNLRFSGKVYGFLVWNRALGVAELLQVQKYISTLLGFAFPTRFVPFEGDSITYGVGISGNDPAQSFPYKCAQSIGLKYGEWCNIGLPGAEPVGLNTLAVSDTDDILTKVGIAPVVVYGEWYNCADGTAKAKNTTYLQKRKAAGAKTVFWTSVDTSTTGQQADRADYNAYWDTAANRAGLVDYYVAVHTNANIGVSGACPAGGGGNTYFNDYTHLKAAGYTVLAGLMQPAIASALS